MKKYFTLLLVISAIFLSAEMRVLERSSDRLLVRIELDDYNLLELGQFTFLEIDNWERNLDNGAPDLPLLEMNFAVPPDGKASFSIISQEVVSRNLNKPISPVANIVEAEKTFDYIYEINPTKYAAMPTEFLSLKEQNTWRHFRSQPIQFNPFQYDPNNQELQICESIIFEVRIEGDRGFRKVINDNCEDIYNEYFVNYNEAKFWRMNSKTEIEKMPFEASEFWYKFSTEENGVYELDFTQLSQLPSFCDPASIRVLTMYREAKPEEFPGYQFKLTEIPILLEDDNSILDEDDRIFFEKTDLDTGNFKSYTTEKTYWLTFGADLRSYPRRITDLINIEMAIPVQDFERRDVSVAKGRDLVYGVLIYPEAGVFDTQSDELIALHPEFPETTLITKSQTDIFDEYGSGDPDPLAIRNYLEVQLNENPELLYCVLMGSGTSDWINSTEKNKIITFDYSDDNFSIFSPYDPQLAMGRLPAQNEADMNYLIDRTRTYIETPTPGFWRNKIVILPDDENKSGGYEGLLLNNISGLNHSQIAQYTGELLNPEIYIDKVMAIEYGFDEFQNKPEARNAMLESVNEGCLIWYYIGHGNEDVLGDEDYFRGSVHMNLIDNLEHLPLFIAASCDVGRFDEVAYDCIAEKLLFYEDGGSIISIAATRSCDGTANTNLMKKYLTNSMNLMPRKTAGWSLFNAKLTSAAGIGNSKQYHILGDPFMYVNPPEIVGSITGIQDSIQSRQFVQFEGDFGSGNLFSNQGELRVFEPQHDFIYINNDYVIYDTLMYEVNYTKEGNKIFFGGNEINSGEYSAEFIVPDDVQTGDDGLILNYYFDAVLNKDFISSYEPMKCSSTPLNVTSVSSPQVTLFVDSEYFMSGDNVSTDPVIMADIQDEDGINITGSPGHRILLYLDEVELIDATDGFVYDLGSATTGKLSWQLNDLSEGKHQVILTVFDNFNNPTVSETEFIAKRSGKVSIEQMLPYPNPMEKDGYFTFVITENSDITITIYTITGRKIRTIKKPDCDSGYNQIYWNGKDGDGDKIANNTYLYKIKAKQRSNNKVSEKIGKVIILK
jgi:Peptidase family C25/Propeptide_C25